MQIFYGRKKLTTSYQKENLNKDVVKRILLDVLPEHELNSKAIHELDLYRLGKQDILQKTKMVRPEINNVVVENYAYSIVDFKTNYVHGNPLTYIQNDEARIESVEILNRYMDILGKQALDKTLGQHRFSFGTGHRIVLPSKSINKDSVPFEIFNLDGRNTACVYSTHFREDKILGFTYYDFKEQETDKYYREYTVYTDNKVYVYRTPTYKSFVSIDYNTLDLEFVEEASHIVGRIPILEYKLNDDRFGLIELIKSQQDALNKITSNELDDIDQFIQSLIVFINTKLSTEGKKTLSSDGVVEIRSDKNLPADIKMLSQASDHSQLKLLYERIHKAMMNVAGVPIISDRNIGGDTGQARLVGDGWTMADERAKSDEFTFERGERELLDIVLSICHKRGVLKDLTLQSIQVKFNRNRTYNLQTKVQALQGLLSTGIVAPDDALRTSELFANYIEVYQKGQVYAQQKQQNDLDKEVERALALGKVNNQSENIEPIQEPDVMKLVQDG